MKIAIHQPEFMPWMGFFYKMALADLYIILDHVQFKKRYFENRNKIISPEGSIMYLSVPVMTKGRYRQAINQVEIDNSQRWKDKIIGRLRNCYVQSPFYKRYIREISSIICDRQYFVLVEVNIEMIKFLRRCFGIITPMILSSCMNTDSYSGSNLILNVCKLTNADIYLCGRSGKDYLKAEDFKKENIDIEWLDYETPYYIQQCKQFIPRLSALDLLFNYGYESIEIIMNCTKKEEVIC